MMKCNFTFKKMIDGTDHCRIKANGDRTCDQEDCIFMKLLGRSARTLPEMLENQEEKP